MSIVFVFDYVKKEVVVVGNNPQQEPSFAKVIDAQKGSPLVAAGSPPERP